MPKDTAKRVDPGAGDTISRSKDKVVFTYGRFNPPHSGHAKLIAKLNEEAQKGSDAYAFVTSTQNIDTDPLDVATKVKYLKKMNPETDVKIINTTVCGCKTMPLVFKALKEAGYAPENMTLVLGKDQFDKGSFGFLKGYGVTITSDELLDRANKMSATSMRTAARHKNINTFSKGTMIGNMNVNNTKELMSKVRAGLGLANAHGGRRTRKFTRRANRTRRSPK